MISYNDYILSRKPSAYFLTNDPHGINSAGHPLNLSNDPYVIQSIFTSQNGASIHNSYFTDRGFKNSTTIGAVEGPPLKHYSLSIPPFYPNNYRYSDFHTISYREENQEQWHSDKYYPKEAIDKRIRAEFFLDGKIRGANPSCKHCSFVFTPLFRFGFVSFWVSEYWNCPFTPDDCSNYGNWRVLVMCADFKNKESGLSEGSHMICSFILDRIRH